MNFAKKFLSLFFLLFLFNFYGNIFSNDSQDSFAANYGQDFGQIGEKASNSDLSIDQDFDIFSDDNSLVNDVLDHEHFSIVKTSVKPQELIDLLLQFNLLEVLKEDLFLKTNPLAKRSLLDNQLFLFDKDYASGKFVFSPHIFYEETSRMYFGASSDCTDGKQSVDYDSCIKSYLALCNPSLLCKIKDLENKIKEEFPDFGIDCLKGLSLIKNATVQERNVGLFLGFQWAPGKFNVRFKVPFYYKERNLYMTQKEIDAITCQFGESDQSENMKFARKHLISDQLGFGDSRIEFDYPVLERPRDLWIRLGGIATIPTACPIVKGVLGEVFCPVKCRPKVSLTKLFDMFNSDATRQDATNQVTDLSMSALDGISSMLLDSNLGNNGHFGLGVKLRSKVPLRSMCDVRCFDRLSLKGDLFLEYLFPHKETRWFVEKNVSSEFDLRNFTDANQADQNLAFLEAALINKIFPFAYDVNIYPGTIFIWEEKLAYEKKKWGAHLGSDIWVQGQERFGNICAPNYQLPSLDIEKAKVPRAYQWSLFGSLFFKPKKQKGDFYVGLNAEKIIASGGIGRPYKLSLSLERNF